MFCLAFRRKYVRFLTLAVYVNLICVTARNPSKEYSTNERNLNKSNRRSVCKREKMVIVLTKRGAITLGARLCVFSRHTSVDRWKGSLNCKCRVLINMYSVEAELLTSRAGPPSPYIRVVRTSYCDVPLWYWRRQPRSQPVSQRRRRPTPVSYTHLDVYKRQW